MTEFQIFSLGDNALTIGFGNIISPELNDLVLAADAALNRAPFSGFIETVPAYSSISVFYDVLKVRKNYPEKLTANETIKALVNSRLQDISQVTHQQSRLIEIPVSFAAEDAPDLDLLAEAKGLSRAEAIEIFTGQTYRVFLLGFLPGFSYMGEVDERIAMPRKETPRTHVPKGSVGIAGRQTGIYSLDSPGGWQIIGRTALEMFLPAEDPPSRLRAGDTVRFVSA
jgi:inhibitor of KinA